MKPQSQKPIVPLKTTNGASKTNTNRAQIEKNYLCNLT